MQEGIKVCCFMMVMFASMFFLVLTPALAESTTVTSTGIKFPDGTTQTTAASGGSSFWSQLGSDIYYNNGSVGIGTSSPGAKLTIQSTIYGDHILNVGGISNGRMLVRHIDGKDGESSNIGDLYLQYGMNHNTILNAESTGKVGIGTTDPHKKLSIYDNSTGAAPIFSIDQNSTGDASMRFLIYDNTGYTVGIDNSDNDNWKISMNEDFSHNLLTITAEVGNVGIGTTSPSYPLEMANGAHVTAGGVWTDASSRDYKENIRHLTYDEAKLALSELTPSKFNYKVDKEDEYLGFIAEDVPDLVATKDRKGLSPMDIVAVLTKVVQKQQKENAVLNTKLAELINRIEALER